MSTQTQHSDVLIIGGGAIGLSAAYYLNAAGLKVTILEKKDIGAGSSYGNAGLVGPRYFVPLASPGVVKKALKWMWNPESPFYIKPRFSPALISWLWKFNAASNAAQMQ
ncbi:MAG: FAD-dependent oxidoreductase, partial [Calditrichaeota bacterium]|nr:FAD-dependent oxidoreductase [Calditrichota bacterium]MCB0312353.1 FAD-dependent oxidoreductase [Calditrichota bacterium]